MRRATSTLSPPPIAGPAVAGLLIAVFCIGPLTLAFLGVSAAGLLLKLKAYRSAFGVLALGLLATGLFVAHRRRAARRGESDCPACDRAAHP